MKEVNIVIVSIIGICIMSISLAGYWILKKEQLSIVVKGEERITSTFAKTVEEVLKELDIKYYEDDKINPDLNTELVDYMDIKVTEVKKLIYVTR